MRCGETLLGIHLASLHLGCCQQALGIQTIQVGHQEVDVFIVEQTVHSDEGIPGSCQFYRLSDG